MPLNKKGNKIMSSMRSEYGDKKGKDVFYASRSKGTISGVDKKSSSKMSDKALKNSLVGDSKKIDTKKYSYSGVDKNMNPIKRDKSKIISSLD